MTRPRSWTVRPATLDDVENFEAVRIATWKTCFREIVSDQFLDGLTLSPHRIQRCRNAIGDVERSSVMVACAGHDIIGMGMAEQARDEQLNAEVGEIRALYVHPDWQGRGVGRALLDALTTALGACGYRAAVLWTMRDLLPTRRFYEANGWASDGAEDTHDWHGPVHLVRYGRDLDDPV
ncbi:MAG: GNAT family N-acetyltransferase [Chloroflexota bacterium]|nr:GNAT family N-acetyltransferase [Chloroflexota bacterium]